MIRNCPAVWAITFRVPEFRLPTETLSAGSRIEKLGQSSNAPPNSVIPSDKNKEPGEEHPPDRIQVGDLGYGRYCHSALRELYPQCGVV